MYLLFFISKPSTFTVSSLAVYWHVGVHRYCLPRIMDDVEQGKRYGRSVVYRPVRLSGQK